MGVGGVELNPDGTPYVPPVVEEDYMSRNASGSSANSSNNINREYSVHSKALASRTISVERPADWANPNLPTESLSANPYGAASPGAAPALVPAGSSSSSSSAASSMITVDAAAMDDLAKAKSATEAFYDKEIAKAKSKTDKELAEDLRLGLKKTGSAIEKALATGGKGSAEEK